MSLHKTGIDVFEYIYEYFQKHNYAPKNSEIATALKRRLSTVIIQKQTLRRLGHIYYIDHVPRMIEIRTIPRQSRLFLGKDGVSSLPVQMPNP